MLVPGVDLVSFAYLCLMRFSISDHRASVPAPTSPRGCGCDGLAHGRVAESYLCLARNLLSRHLCLADNAL